MLFIPDGQSVAITYKADKPTTPNKDHTNQEHRQHFQAQRVPAALKVFATVNLFTSLTVPAFIIKDNTALGATLANIFIEKDTAYFCQRFMMKFGISASNMRSRELIMHSIAQNHFLLQRSCPHAALCFIC